MGGGFAVITTIDNVEIKVLDGRILARRLDGQPLTDEDRLLATLVAITRPDEPPPPQKYYSDVELEVADLIVRCRELYCLFKLLRYNLQPKAAETVMSSVTYRRLEGKNIVACKVFSRRAKDGVWLIDDDKYLSDDEVDGKAIFYFSEIPYLTNLEPDQLLSILRYKAVFPRSKVVQSDQRRRSSSDRTGGQRNVGARAEKKKKKTKVEEEVF